MKTFRTLALSTLLTSMLSLPAMAENSGVYTSIGFQYSQLKVTNTTAGPEGRTPIKALGTAGGQTIIGNMYGLGINVGYKHFFGKTKRNGLRYYGFYDYAYSNPLYAGAGRSNNNVYGVGIDYLFNFVDKDNIQAGLFFGVAIAGSSWSNTGQASARSFCKDSAYCRDNFTYVQVPLEWGIRTNINKHNGFEIGMKVPLVQNYWVAEYNNTKGTGPVRGGITYKRSVVFYVNYVYNF
ncbi:outer membrane protein [Helicobacter cetorum]|uniref:outer membrane protein n=1 Tax=Helicobacter cetorum TaxID=138563 RepID=UPI001F3A9D0F|nr:outer membrane protein [Helicobacter cetorum]